MMARLVPLSMTAVRDEFEGTLCAPFCGRGCTIEEHDHAAAESDAMAAELTKITGHPWEAKPHENLGWHSCATNGPIRVHVNNYPTGLVTYSVTGGTPFASSGATLAEAIADFRGQAQAHLDEATETYSRVVSILEEAR